MRPYSPGGTLIALAAARRGSIPPTPSVHSLRRGLPGYLIRFAPHAIASQRQVGPRKPPSPQVFLPISTHITTTPGIPLSSTPLKSASIQRPLPVEPGAFTLHLTDRLHALYASKSGQRLPPTYYRGCWHVVSRGLFAGYRHYLPLQKGFTTRRPSSPTRRCWVRLSPIPKIPSCCLP